MEDKATFGVYRNRREVDQAIQKLRVAGFAPDNISVLLPHQKKNQKDLAYKQITSVQKGALIGSAIGCLAIGLIGVLIASRTLTFAGLPILSTSDGVSIVLMSLILGALWGAAVGALVGVGTPKPVEERYGLYLHEGGVVLSVHYNNEEQNKSATEILVNTGAEDVSSLDEARALKNIFTEERKLEAQP